MDTMLKRLQISFPPTRSPLPLWEEMSKGAWEKWKSCVRGSTLSWRSTREVLVAITLVMDAPSLDNPAYVWDRTPMRLRR